MARLDTTCCACYPIPPTVETELNEQPRSTLKLYTIIFLWFRINRIGRRRSKGISLPLENTHTHTQKEKKNGVGIIKLILSESCFCTVGHMGLGSTGPPFTVMAAVNFTTESLLQAVVNLAPTISVWAGPKQVLQVSLQSSQLLLLPSQPQQIGWQLHEGGIK